MTLSYFSHRQRIQEKQVFRKIILVLVFSIFSLFLAAYAGLPILAKIIVLFSPVKREKQVEQVKNEILFPPVFNSVTEATNSSPISLSGIGGKNATVKIYVDNREKAKASTDNDGKFVILRLNLTEGTNTITAKTIKDNKESSPSAPLVIVLMKENPNLEVERPTDNERITSDDNKFTVSGQTDPENRILVNDRVAIVNQQGKFNFNVNLSNGENNFKIVAIDPAGNQTVIERKVNYNP